MAEHIAALHIAYVACGGVEGTQHLFTDLDPRIAQYAQNFLHNLCTRYSELLSGDEPKDAKDALEKAARQAFTETTVSVDGREISGAKLEISGAKLIEVLAAGGVFQSDPGTALSAKPASRSPYGSSPGQTASNRRRLGR